MRGMLKRENVRLVDGVRDWEEAVRVSLESLERQGYVEPTYADAVIEATRNYGAYYVLCPGVALVHGRPQDGVNRKQLALTLLNEPVYFEGKEWPVRLFIALAAEDARSHLDALQYIGELLGRTCEVDRLLACETAEALYDEFVNPSCEEVES